MQPHHRAHCTSRMDVTDFLKNTLTHSTFQRDSLLLRGLPLRGARSLKIPSCNLYRMGSNLDPNWGSFSKPKTLTLMPKYPTNQLRAQGIRPRTPGNLYWLLFNTGNLDWQSSLSGNCSIWNFSYRKILHWNFLTPENRQSENISTGNCFTRIYLHGNSRPEKVRPGIIFPA